MNKQLKREQERWKDEEYIFSQKQKKAEDSLEELKNAGNIKQAAVVFSHEGMEMFAKIFGNTMERIVEDAVERKARALMEGLFEGVSEQYLALIKPKLLLEKPKEPEEQQYAEPEPDPQAAFRERNEKYRQGKIVKAENGMLQEAPEEPKPEATKPEKPKNKVANKKWSDEEKKELIDLARKYKGKEGVAKTLRRYAEMSGRTEKAICYKFYKELKHQV